MNNKGIGVIGGILVVLLIALIAYLVYWAIVINMEIFEVLFGNGWLYLGFVILGGILSMINISLYDTRHGAKICINVGGCVLPLIVTIFLLNLIWSKIDQWMLVIALIIAIIISRLVSWHVRGKGVLVVGVIITISSGFMALIIPFASGYSGIELLTLKLAFGYIIATLGVIIGADLLHLGMIERNGSWGEKLSMGGAGIEDGIWVVGLNAMFFIFLFYKFGIW